MAKRAKATGNKRQRERDKRRKREEKTARKQWRKDMRARGLDPDAMDPDADPDAVAEGVDGEPGGEGGVEEQGEGASTAGAPAAGELERPAAEGEAPEPPR